MRASYWFLCLKKTAITFVEGCRSLLSYRPKRIMMPTKLSSWWLGFQWVTLSKCTISIVLSVNCLWPHDAIERHRTRSTLAQVMACCLKTPSHKLNQCWLIIMRSFGVDLRAISQAMLITAPSTRGQWGIMFAKLSLLQTPPSFTTRVICGKYRSPFHFLSLVIYN